MVTSEYRHMQPMIRPPAQRPYFQLAAFIWSARFRSASRSALAAFFSARTSGSLFGFPAFRALPLAVSDIAIARGGQFVALKRLHRARRFGDGAAWRLVARRTGNANAAYVSLTCVSMAAEAADESDAASPRAPPTGDAHAKAGPGLFNMNAFRVPRLAKGLNLPPVTLPSLDTSGALAHSFRFWQPRADAQCGGPEVGGDERLIRANTVNEAETRVARDSGDGADEIRAATPPTRLPVCGNPAAAENREESEPPLPSPGGGGGAPGLHGQLMGIRSLLPELKVPQLSSFPQPWADSTPADACDCAAPTDDPTGAADSNSRALQKRASLLAEEGQPAWYAGVLGTKKKSDYAQTTRTWQGGHSRAPEPNVSVRSSDSVQLPRAPGDKDYDKLDAARCLSRT